MIVVCPECGSNFITSYNSLLSVSNQRCSQCSKSESQGEYKIRKYFESNNINFIQEHSFQNCFYKHVLSFDFYIQNMNVAIEYDGAQHFRPIKRKNMTEKEAIDSFKENKIRDKIKNEYCKQNNILLIRIAYTDFNNIEKILDNFFLNTHEDIV